MKGIKKTISYDDFSKLDIRVGEVLSVEKIEKSEKLLKLEVNFGDLGSRQILSGISEWYLPEDLLGKKCVFIVNLQPRKMMGLESQGMVLMSEENSKPIFIIPEKSTKNGEPVI